MYICGGNVNDYKILKTASHKEYLTKLKYWVDKHDNDGKG